MKYRKISFLLAITAIMVAFLFSSSLAWPWSKKKERPISPYRYEFPSGWKVIEMMPTIETKRVSKFESMISRCEPCMEEIFKRGNFLLFREIRTKGYENWWTMVVDIPDGYFLNIPKQARIAMQAVDKSGDTLYIESKRIVFCKGWFFSPDGERMYQHTVLDNSRTNIQVKPYRGIGREDFENGEIDGKKYIVGYAYFGEKPRIKEVMNFQFVGMDIYPVSQNLSRR